MGAVIMVVTARVATVEMAAMGIWTGGGDPHPVWTGGEHPHPHIIPHPHKIERYGNLKRFYSPKTIRFDIPVFAKKRPPQKIRKTSEI